MSRMIDSEPGVVLHSVPYKENSLLVTLFTLNYGKLSAVVRLSTRVGSRNRGSYEPFTLMRFSLAEGRSALLIVNDVFLLRPVYAIKVPRIFSATYLNELLLYLLTPKEPEPTLFAAYTRALERLEQDENESEILRDFESTLLSSIGYAISYETYDGKPLEHNSFYSFNPYKGFVQSCDNAKGSYSGEALIQIKNHLNTSVDTQKILKNLNASVIDALLEGRPLRSREMYAQFLMVS